jgi:hypothetical protein
LLRRDRIGKGADAAPGMVKVMVNLNEKRIDGGNQPGSLPVLLLPALRRKPDRPHMYSVRSGLMTVLMGAVLLGGCVSPAPYGPRLPGQQTGYTDRELTPNRYRVTFSGNSATPRATVEDYLLLRAAEVTLAGGATHFVFDDRDTQAHTRLDAMPVGGPGPGPYGGFGGFYGGWGFRPAWGYDPFGPEVMITQTTRYEAYAEIVLLKPGQEANESRAVDARAVIAHLSPPIPATPDSAQTPAAPGPGAPDPSAK